MPTYVYECKKCKKVTEVEQRMTEQPLKDCPCGSKGTLVRLIQPTAVMFKGSGFHINDYSAPVAAEKPEPISDAPEPATKPETTL